MKRKVNAISVITVVLLLALLVASGCQRAEVEQAAGAVENESKGASVAKDEVRPGSTSSEESGAEARRGGDNGTSGSGKARAGEARAGGSGAGNKSGVRPGEVRLKINGKRGTPFTGTCSIGDEEREVSGQVPERFVYEPEGRKVECELRNEGPDAGQLKFFVDARASNQKQKIRVTGDNIDFTFSGDGISYTASSASSSSSSSVVQKSRVSSSSYSSSSVSSSSSSR